MRIRVSVVFLLLLFTFCLREVRATTWAPKEVVCPLCSTKNTFMDIASYGTYIYQWPEKFQFIYWPLTDANVLYSCKKCRLTAFMWDFAEIPKEKLPAIKTKLDTMALKPVEGEYYKIPMSNRLDIAAEVYSTLGMDETFWCKFYRVKGFHYEAEKREADATSARAKALEICQKQLAMKENAGIRKELLLISGAMRYFLNDNPAALKDLREATELTYTSSKLDSEQSKNFNAYLSSLLKEYVARIEAGVKPGNR